MKDFNRIIVLLKLYTICIFFLHTPALSAQEKKEVFGLPLQIAFEGLIFDATSTYEMKTVHSENRIHPFTEQPEITEIIGPEFSTLVTPVRLRIVHLVSISANVVLVRSTRWSPLKQDHEGTHELLIFENLADYNNYFLKHQYNISEIHNLQLNRTLSDTHALKKHDEKIESLKRRFIAKHGGALKNFYGFKYRINKNSLFADLAFGAAEKGLEWGFRDITHVKSTIIATLPRAMLPLPCDVEIAAAPD